MEFPPLKSSSFRVFLYVESSIIIRSRPFVVRISIRVCTRYTTTYIIKRYGCKRIHTDRSQTTRTAAVPDVWCLLVHEKFKYAAKYVLRVCIFVWKNNI